MILLLHATASSLHFQLRADAPLLSGKFARIGQEHAYIHLVTPEEEYTEAVGDIDHRVALRSLIDRCQRNGHVGALDKLTVVVYRVSHGADRFADATLMTRESLRLLHGITHLSPDIPAAVSTISAGLSQLPTARHVAVFDTAFTAAMPPEATEIPIDKETAGRLHVRRYGFGGIIHRAAYGKARDTAGTLPRRVISVHFGTRTTATAIVDGVAVETTSGFTIADGLPGLVGSGALDPRIPLYLAAHLRLSPREADRVLAHHSGLAALTGRNSYESIEAGAKEGDSACVRGLMLLSYRTAQAIASMLAATGGIDAIIFSGPGASQAVIEEVVRRLAVLEIRLGKRREGVISAPSSKVLVLRLPLDEEDALLHEAWRALGPMH